VQDQVIGTLVLLGTTGRTFTVDDVGLATAFASHAAVALQNSRLFAERLETAKRLETRERQQAAIVRIGGRALGAVHVDALLDEAAAIVSETLGIERVATFELSEDCTMLTPRAGLRWTEEMGDAVEVVRNSATSRLLATSVPVVFEDASARVSLLPPAFLTRHGIVSGVEVVFDGLIPPFGVLAAYSDRPRRFSEDDVTFLRTVASVIGMAIVGIRAESALRRHADRLRIMREIDQAILAARSSSETAAVALEHLVKLVPCWRASVLLFDHEEATVSVFAVTGACEDQLPAGDRFPLADIGRNDLDELREGRVHLVPDLSTIRPWPAMHQFAVRGLRSYFRVPLTVRGELIGALTVLFDRPHAFSGVDVELT
jgi:GAF domain-containing protein